VGLRIASQTSQVPCALCQGNPSMCEGNDSNACNGVLYLGNAFRSTPLYFGSTSPLPSVQATNVVVPDSLDDNAYDNAEGDSETDEMSLEDHEERSVAVPESIDTRQFAG
jgi:hypothetical protein